MTKATVAARLGNKGIGNKLKLKYKPEEMIFRP
jgi:hypothetical protein